MKIIRRGGIVYLHDPARNLDVVALTPMEAQWLSFELRPLLLSEFCLQLQLASYEANKAFAEDQPTTREFPIGR